MTLHTQDPIKLSLMHKEETLPGVVQILFVAYEETKKSSSRSKKKMTSNKRVLVSGCSSELSRFVQSESEGEQIEGQSKEVQFYRNHNGVGHLMILGLGDVSNIDCEVLRRSIGHGIKLLGLQKIERAAVLFDSLAPYFKQKDEAMMALCESIALASYNFDALKSSKSSQKRKKLSHVTVVATKSQDKKIKEAFEQGKILGEAANITRFLGDSPGNKMTPTILGEMAQKISKGTPLKVSLWDRARIQKEKMGAFLGVAQGSDQPPRMIVLEYKGTAASKKPICFVGKGLTFDSGGISLKPSTSMEEMKYDMCGGGAVIGAMWAIAKMRLKVNAIAFVPATENMPGPRATKPGDVFVARNGKCVEVNNTDAEGRLILADALTYASEQKPAMIVDAATLTGAMSIALGNIYTGYFTRDEKLNGKIEKAANRSGEKIWRMPLSDEHVEDIKGTFGDLSNMSSQRGAGSSTAAAFLEQFVGKEVPWAHFDIAGTAWNVSNRVPYCSKGASGVMVRTFVELARDLG